MANRRMFSLQIIDTDAFLDMPATSQLLYFHLTMRADDEGFVGNPKKVIRLAGLHEDDLKVLIAKRFVLHFESGVVVIKHWLIHNTIRLDRFSDTTYQDEKRQLAVKENKSYTEALATSRQPDGNHLAPQYKLSKVNLIKSNLIERGANAPTPAQEAQEFFNNSERQLEITRALQNTYGHEDLIAGEIKKFIEYWTELNKSGTKQRWELERTFELKRRLKTWFNNIKNFSSFHEKNHHKINIVGL